MSTLVATLIANPKMANLTTRLIDKAARAVKATNICVLAENIAADLSLPQGATASEFHATLAKELTGMPLDIIVQSATQRRKKLLLADMDSTIIAQECIDELAKQMGMGAKIAAITDRAMRGELDFAQALTQRVVQLKDLPLSVIDEVLTKRITVNTGARELIATMRAHGAYTALVSGGFTLFTQEIAKRLHFDEHHANILLHDHGRLTGQVAQPILGAEAKQQKLLHLCQKLELDPSQVIAVGDGANDIPMLQQAGNGVAFHAKPKVQAATTMHINHGDLTALLYIQGYKEQDFVS